MTEVVYLNDRRYPGPSYHPASDDITGLPTQEELDAYPRMFTWGELKQTIIDGRLENLMRNKEMQARYNSWTKGIKERFGSTEKYLTQSRLPFPRAGSSSGSSSTSRAEPTYDPKTLDGGPSSPKALSHTLPDGTSETSTRSGQAPRPGLDYLRYDAEAGFDESKYAVLNNDWPYNIPQGVRHFCVWSRVPIAHPSLVDDDPAAWAKIEEEGLGGFTGILPISTPLRPVVDPSCLPSIPTQASALALASSGTATSTTTSTENTNGSTDNAQGQTGYMRHPLGWGAATLAEFGEEDWYAVDLKFGGPELQKWANRQYEAKGGQEVGKMVKGLWDERGWECLWFVNPPRLQSVPGLSHFHVFARRKTPEEIDAGERIWGKSEQ
ncbi:hypothetical protein IAU59_005490 [Kwoniella sp. CBS 9459]